MQGGLSAWQQAGYLTDPVSFDQPASADESGNGAVSQSSTLPVVAEVIPPPVATHAHTFLSTLVGNYLAQPHPPVKKELTVLFVDIADSTATVVRQPPDVALALVQHFMGIITDIALSYCGDVNDYEGDGALLYFESVTEAVQAALAIRTALSRQQETEPIPLRVRLSLNVGPMVFGVIGTPLRRSVAIIGPSINLASRLLKHIPPGGIIATAAIVERLHQEAPDLASRFHLWSAHLELRGFDNEAVPAFHIP